MFKYEEGDFFYIHSKCLIEANFANCLDLISGRRGYYARLVWFLLCHGINIFISDNDDRSAGLQCIEIEQAHVDNIYGYNCVCHPDGKQTDSVVISHCCGVDTTSHAVLNTINTRKINESYITSSLATVYTTYAPITSVQLPCSCAGNFK